MKTLKILLVLFFVALLYAGCRKEKEIVQGNLPAAGNSLVNGQRIEPENMEDAMNAFISQTNREYPEIISDYEAQDALLIIEAALNYHTCMPDSGYDEVAVDTFTFELPLYRTPTSP